MPTGEPSFVPYQQVRDLQVTGTCNLPAASVTNTNFTGAGSTALESTKVVHQHVKTWGDLIGVACTTQRRTVHQVYGAVGTILSLKAKMPVACTAGSTCVVTWYKNGSSIGTATFNDAGSANEVKTVAPSSSSLVAGDHLEVGWAVTGGTPGQGVSASHVLTEYPA